MIKKRAFSLYDVEQFLREAGAERINERAVISLEKELQDTVNEIVDEASVYANYAGRKRVINAADVRLANKGGPKRYLKYKGHAIRRKSKQHQANGIEVPKLMLVNNMPVVKAPPGFQ